VVSAAVREAREECGTEIAAADVSVSGVMHRLSGDERIDFFVTAYSWTGEIANAEPGKCDELRWCHRDALPDNTIPYVRSALENFRQGLCFSSFGWD
jgi:8-oxo-dGTP diphosphatase